MCSYCGCERVAVVGRFMAEHAEIVNACGDLRRACAADGTGVVRAADRLRSLLRPHTRAEEIGRMAEADPSTGSNAMPVNAKDHETLFRNAVHGKL